MIMNDIMFTATKIKRYLIPKKGRSKANLQIYQKFLKYNSLSQELLFIKEKNQYTFALILEYFSIFSYKAFLLQEINMV